MVKVFFIGLVLMCISVIYCDVVLPKDKLTKHYYIVKFNLEKGNYNNDKNIQ